MGTSPDSSARPIRSPGRRPDAVSVTRCPAPSSIMTSGTRSWPASWHSRYRLSEAPLPIEPPSTVTSSAPARAGRPLIRPDPATRASAATGGSSTVPTRLPDLEESVRVEQAVESLTGVEPSPFVLAMEAGLAAHGPGLGLPTPDLLQGRTPPVELVGHQPLTGQSGGAARLADGTGAERGPRTGVDVVAGVHVEEDTGDGAGLLGQEEGHRRGDVVGLGQPSEEQVATGGLTVVGSPEVPGAFGLGEAGTDRVDPNSASPEVVGQGAGQGVERRFGCGIGGHRRRRLLRRPAGDVDDGSAVVGQAPGHRLLDERQGRPGVQGDRLHQLIPAHGQRRSDERGTADRVDQEVDPAEPLDRRPHQEAGQLGVAGRTGAGHDVEALAGGGPTRWPATGVRSGR